MRHQRMGCIVLEICTLALIALKVPQMAAVVLLGILLILIYGRIRKSTGAPDRKP